MKTLKELASLCGGELCGDPSIKIERVSDLTETKEGSLVFVFEKRSLGRALASKAVAVVAPQGSDLGKKPGILTKNPRLAMAKVLKSFAPACELDPGIHKTAVVHKSAKLGKNVRVGALSYIGPQVEIGEDSLIYPQATIHAGVKIGKRCVIHSGARLGTDGFGFEFEGKKWEKIPQIGGLIIGDEVEVYSNVCVARATLGATVIGSGTKIDNLVQVAHNCKLGENCAVASLVGFSGSVTLGKNVIVAGQAGFNNRITVGDNSVVLAKSGVTKDVPADSMVSGFPAIDHKEDLASQVALRKLIKQKNA